MNETLLGASPLECGVGRPVPERSNLAVQIAAAGEAYLFAVALDPKPGESAEWSGADVSAAFSAGFHAGVKYLADLAQPAAWVLEWGAISLPSGDSARITAMSAHRTEAEAIAEGETCDFNWQVFPAYCIGSGKPPNK